MSEALELKEKGNACLKDGKYHEALLHYSHAIKREPNNHLLYSNRSHVLLKLEQHFLALEDAKRTIQLDPKWPKGYYRQGQVEMAAGFFADACISFTQALALQPHDPTLHAAIQAAGGAARAQRAGDRQLPYLGAGVGIILGVLLVLADVFTPAPKLNHPVPQILLVLLVAGAGYGVCKAYRLYLAGQRRGLLQPPLDLLAGSSEASQADAPGEGEGAEPPPARHHKFTKAQARRRYRNGKR
ncbi:hsp70-Hsp90 organizing protein-like [Pollicipes pollicipes]|uniref:hsp70-Hsp90 organizing protein-like n=1 Tax=Pollicipes pollicipes TaxID=41117 RepID=UPI0018857E45|nr:hsp70-Hsp90 organizing protein-like [Pollicipes pollicipes]